MGKYDVVIVGGGTAGLLLARELGKLKRKTLVVDRKSNLLEFSFNTLASFMNLDDFGLSEGVVAQKLDKFVLHSRSFKSNLKVDAYILDKKKVHEELLNAIDLTYVTLLTNIDIRNVERENSGLFTSIIDKKGNHFFGDIFVDASGTNGVISKTMGLRDKKVQLATGLEYNVKYLGNPKEAHLLAGKKYQGGYGWIFPLKNKRAIIGFGSFNNKVVKDLKSQINRIFELPEIKKLIIKDTTTVEGGSIPLTPVLDKFVLKNLVCVGDSVSQVNPIAGEGYKYIFEAAIMASIAIDTALEKKDIQCLFSYEVEWKKRFYKNYKRSKFAQEKIYKYSENDYIMDFAMLLMKFRSNKRMVESLSGEYK